jgi:hypothetical protein
MQSYIEKLALGKPFKCPIEIANATVTYRELLNLIKAYGLNLIALDALELDTPLSLLDVAIILKKNYAINHLLQVMQKVGEDINSIYGDFTHLHIAGLVGNTEAISKLLSHDADPEILTPMEQRFYDLKPDLWDNDIMLQLGTVVIKDPIHAERFVTIVESSQLLHTAGSRLNVELMRCEYTLSNSTTARFINTWRQGPYIGPTIIHTEAQYTDWVYDDESSLTCDWPYIEEHNIYKLLRYFP